MSTTPETYARIGAAGTPVFSRDGRTLFHLRGAGLPQVWALDLDTGAGRQLTFHDEKVAVLRRAPTDDRLVYGIDRGGDERQQLLLIDPEEERPQPRALTDDPSVIHDWGAWSPEGTHIAFAANARDEANFDIYLQEVATGARRCVYQGTGIVSVAGFHPDGAVLTLLADRGYADMSLLLLDLGSGEATEFRADGGTNYQSARWVNPTQYSPSPCGRGRGEGSVRHQPLPPTPSRKGRGEEAPRPTPTLLALTDGAPSDHLRLCRLDPATTTPETIYAASDRDVEAWALSPDGTTLATIENDRGYSILRLGPLNTDRPIITLPQGVITDPTFAPDNTTLAFTLATPTVPSSIWLCQDNAARPLVQPDPAPTTCVDPTLVHWTSFDGTQIPGWLALPPTQHPHQASPPSSGCTAARSASRAPTSAPTSRCWSPRASPSCSPTSEAVPATAAPTRKATTSTNAPTASPISRTAATGSPPTRRSTPPASASWASPTAASWSTPRSPHTRTLARRRQLLRYRRLRNVTRRHRPVAPRPSRRRIRRPRPRRRAVRPHLTDPPRRPRAGARPARARHPRPPRALHGKRTIRRRARRAPEARAIPHLRLRRPRLHSPADRVRIYTAVAEFFTTHLA